MKRVEIVTGKAGDMVKIEVSDQFDMSILYVHAEDFAKVKQEGKRSILDLISERCPSQMERTLRASVEGGYPVYLDGEEMPAIAVALSFNMNALRCSL